jgi:hypothetical protein
VTSVVVWKWEDPKHERGRDFKAEYYNILYSMLARNITIPDWRMICVTDNTHGLRKEIECVKQPVDLAHVRSLHGESFPSCYRRLWNFHPLAGRLLGDEFLAIDVDIIVTGNIDKFLLREEKFVGWTDPAFIWNKIAGGLYFLKAGSHPEVWNDFDSVNSPLLAKQAGYFGSDQGWLSYKLWPPKASFTRDDGAYYCKWIATRGGKIPEHVRLVSTPGKNKPWDIAFQRKHPWIMDYWKL